MNRGTLAIVAGLAACGALLYAGGRAEPVAQVGAFSDTAASGWDFASFESGVYDNAKYEAVFVAGPGVVHEFTITATYKPQTWAFYDSDKLGDPGRKICTVIVQPGETVQLAMDVRVRRGVVGRVNEGTQATATVTFLAD